MKESAYIGPEKQIEPGKDIFLEVGPARSSGVPVKGKKKFGEGESYIGVEVSKESAEGANQLLKSIKKTRKHDGSLKVISGDAAEMKFMGDHSVSKIFFGDVIGHPQSRSVARFIPEIKRVLKPGGELIIKETISPHLAPLESTVEVLKQNGFVIKKIVKPTDNNWNNELEPYDYVIGESSDLMTQDSKQKFGYFLIATLEQAD